MQIICMQKTIMPSADAGSWTRVSQCRSATRIHGAMTRLPRVQRQPSAAQHVPSPCPPLHMLAAADAFRHIGCEALLGHDGIHATDYEFFTVKVTHGFFHSAFDVAVLLAACCQQQPRVTLPGVVRSCTVNQLRTQQTWAVRSSRMQTRSVRLGGRHDAISVVRLHADCEMHSMHVVRLSKLCMITVEQLLVSGQHCMHALHA